MQRLVLFIEPGYQETNAWIKAEWYLLRALTTAMSKLIRLPATSYHFELFITP